MEEVGEVKEKKGKENRFGRRYGFEIKLRCVKLHLEEGFRAKFAALSSSIPIMPDSLRRVSPHSARYLAAIFSIISSSNFLC
jgi:hypothetical protein